MKENFSKSLSRGAYAHHDLTYLTDKLHKYENIEQKSVRFHSVCEVCLASTVAK